MCSIMFMPLASTAAEQKEKNFKEDLGNSSVIVSYIFATDCSPTVI